MTGAAHHIAASRHDIAPLAITMGEPAGVGGEIVLKCWQRRQKDRLVPFYVIDSPGRLREMSLELKLEVPIREIEEASQVHEWFDDALPVLAIDLPVNVSPGHPDPANGDAVVQSIDRAVAATRDGSASGIVTSPIHKASLYRAGFDYPGHTEYLGMLADRPQAVMMLVIPGLRVVPVTTHLSLLDAIQTLSADAIVRVGRVCNQSLVERFGISHPRLVVAALNPHAGEEDQFGDEERTLIRPAIDLLVREGIDARGPVPADTMFHAAAREAYDAAICMYHDQALIPLKTIDFEGGVNVTLGLPFIRTSPDHGTAFDIAGKGIANETSMLAAMNLAAQMARHWTVADASPISAHG